MQAGQPQVQDLPPIVVCPAKTTYAEPVAFPLFEVGTIIGKQKRQRATNNILFNMELFSFEGKTNHVLLTDAFYQQIASKLIKAADEARVWISLANQLITLAEHALDLKQTETLEQISQILTNAPLPRKYRNIGYFYQVFCLKRRGEINGAQANFQQLAESPDLPLNFRARARQVLGAIYLDKGQVNEALRSCAEATRMASTRQGNDPLTMFNAQSLIGICKSINGDHRGALLQFENVLPLVQVLAPSQPLVHYVYINSLAVELSELGRLEEAQRLTEIAVTSPYAAHYPEWHETKLEILGKIQQQRPSPSVVSNSAWPPAPSPQASGFQASSNVIALPTTPRPMAGVSASTGQSQSAQIIAYHGWKQVSPKATNGAPEKFTPGDLQQMSIADKQHALLQVIYSEDVTHDQLDRMLDAAGSVITDVSVN
jgi:tetratricopeptide (TPR) repeat protein